MPDNCLYIYIMCLLVNGRTLNFSMLNKYSYTVELYIIDEALKLKFCSLPYVTACIEASGIFYSRIRTLYYISIDY